MRYKRFCLLLFFCFISTTKLLSQQYIAPGFTLFGSEAGLNQSTITYLFQDSTGLMWVASYAGLHKFNGNKFQKINPTHFSDQKYGLVIRHIFQKGKNIYFLDDKNIYQYNFLSKKIELFYSYENESSFKILTLTQKGFYIYRFISNSIEFVHFKGQIEKINITNSKRSAEQICTSGKHIYLTDNFGNLLIYKHEKQTLKSLQG